MREQSLSICKENDICDFDLAFAFEAMGRAYSILGNKEQSNESIGKAEELRLQLIMRKTVTISFLN